MHFNVFRCGSDEPVPGRGLNVGSEVCIGGSIVNMTDRVCRLDSHTITRRTRRILGDAWFILVNIVVCIRRLKRNSSNAMAAFMLSSPRIRNI